MWYGIEESTTGKFMINYTINPRPNSLEPDITLDLLAVWETNLTTIVKPDIIKDSFGIDLEEFKKVIGKAVYKCGFPMNTWLRVEIKNIM